MPVKRITGRCCHPWLAVLCLAAAASAGTKYVTPTGGGGKTGADWANAYDSIQTAINNSPVSGDIIYLKSGTYSLTAQLVVSNHPGLIIRGGYQGLTGTPGILTNAASLVKRDAAVTYMRLARIYRSTTSVERVTLADGKQYDTSAHGACFRVEAGSSLDLRDCIVSNHNEVYNNSKYGGAIYMDGGGKLDIRDSRFVNNRITGGWWWEQGYGGAIACVNVDVVVSNVQFLGNYVYCRAGYQRGGTLYLSGGLAVLADNVWSNSSVYSDYVHDTCFSLGGALYALDVVPLEIRSNRFVRCKARMQGGTSVEYGDVLYLDGATTQARITGSVFLENGVDAGSRNLYLKNGTVWMDRVMIHGGMGAGMFQAGGLVMATNLLVYGQTGHGFWGTGGSAQLMHATIARNAGWGVTNAGVMLSLTNSIVYENTSTYYADSRNLVTNGVTVRASCVYPLIPGAGNIQDHPAFTDAAAGDFRLLPGSAAIDRGLTAGSTPDLDGVARPQDGDGDSVAASDMGAYEAPAQAGGEFRCGFTAATNEAYEVLHAELTAYLSGPVTNAIWYGWDIDGDGSFEYQGAGLGSITHSFGPGFHVVSLRVTNILNQAAAITRGDYIRVLTTTLHVAPGAAPVPPYATWATAATNLPSALAVAPDHATILVTNGNYAVPTVLVLNRPVTIRSVNGPAVTILDANASSGSRRRILELSASGIVVDGFTLKRGYYNGNGGAVYMTGNSCLQNCWLTNNTAVFGGAVYMTTGVLSNCVVRNNQSTDMGGGGSSGRGAVYMTGGMVVDSTVGWNTSSRAGAGIRASGGTIRRCVIRNNTAGHGGGGICVESGSAVIEDCLIMGNASGSWGGGGGGILLGGGRVVHCTISDNRTLGTGGGIYNGAGTTVSNSIVWYNTQTDSGQPDDLYAGTGVRWTCSPDLVHDPGGTGNRTNEPAFENRPAGDYRLAVGSPCVDAGGPGGLPVDLEGQARPQDGDGDSTALPDLGCYERADASSGVLRCDFSAPVVQAYTGLMAVLTATVQGAQTNGVTYRWDFTNDGTFNRTGTEYRSVTNGYGPGFHTVRLVASNGFGEVAEKVRTNYLHVGPAVVYVSPTGSNLPPYDTWERASVALASAMQMAVDGSEVLVQPGTYSITSTITLNQSVELRSVSGPADTIIQRGVAELRLLAVSHPDAVVDGFTWRNGYWMQNGGGAFVSDGLIRNCVFTNNGVVNAYGGGVCMIGGTLQDSIITKSTATGGGGSGTGGGLYVPSGNPLIERCRIERNLTARGGAAGLVYGGTLRHCVIAYNDDGYGGAMAMYGGTLVDCLVYGNRARTATPGGGGVLLAHDSARAINCTIVGNEAFGASGGGIYRTAGSATNCIVAGNYATGVQKDLSGSDGIGYSCSTDLTGGAGNITDDPGFLLAGVGYGLSHVPGDYRLDVKADSACIGAGINLPELRGQRDLDGNPRIMAVTIDMGCYEYQPPSGTLLIVR